ncbi:MAG: hypothetical protein NZ520_05440, partial [bacterium]|nr:hypothetical protein [bacterium]
QHRLQNDQDWSRRSATLQKGFGGMHSVASAGAQQGAPIQSLLGGMRSVASAGAQLKGKAPAEPFSVTGG